MKHKRYIAAALLLPLAAFEPRSESVGFHPESGTVLTKTFEVVSDLVLDDMAMVMNGNEMDASMMGMEMETTSTMRIVVSDEYEDVDGSRPLTLVRTFEELSLKTDTSMSSSMMGDQSMDMDGQSELEGTSVVFSWNDEDEEYTLSFAEDSSGDEELLDGLEEDMDLRGLLPDEEVGEGDSWDVDPQVLRGLLAPGGAVKIEIEMDEEIMGMGGGPQPTPDQIIGDIEGELTATFSGTREEDGILLGVIEIEVDVSSAKDVTDVMAEMMEDMPSPEGVELEMDVEAFDAEITFEGSGEVLWNLEAGTFYALELEGEMTTLMDASMNMSAGGQDFSVENSISMSGTSIYTASTSNGS